MILSPEARERLDHARRLERIDLLKRRRGFHVPARLEADYQSLRTRHRFSAAEAAAMLGITPIRTAR